MRNLCADRYRYFFFGAMALQSAAGEICCCGFDALIDAWMEENRSAVDRANAILSDLKEADTLDIAMVSVALREIRNLSETGSAAVSTGPAAP